MSNDIKILQGKFNYLSQNKIYSEENFRVYREEGRRISYLFKCEVLSRVKTGEFLKVYIEYRVSRHFDPIEISITRLMGNKESKENFSVDPKTKNYTYTFQTKDGTQSYDKVLTSRPHIATPAFTTSMLMTNQKRLDPVQRTNYTLITSDNVWEYQGPFFEKSIFVELQALEPKDVMVSSKTVKALHCKLLSSNLGTSSDQGHDIYLSKHFNIPYLGIFSDDLKITTDHLQSLEANLPQF